MRPATRRDRGLEVHTHTYLRGGHYVGSEWTTKVVHSHEGGDAPHEHPGVGPASYTIDKDEWLRTTGLTGGGRKKFTKTPSGPQLERVELEPWQTSFTIIVGEPPPGAAAGADPSSGGGVPTAARMILGHRMHARINEEDRMDKNERDKKAHSGSPAGDFEYPKPGDSAPASSHMRTVDGPAVPYAAAAGDETRSRKVVPFTGSALEQLLKDSGLSGAQFAESVLAARGDRSFRRWQSDGIPAELEEWAKKAIVRLERSGRVITLTLRVPTGASDRRGAGSGDDSA